MFSKKNSSLISFLMACCSLMSAEPGGVPGRLSNSEISTATFGETRLFFYMTPEKQKLAQDFIYDIEENMLHTIAEAELDFPVYELSPIATEFRDPISFDKENNPIYLDHKGMTVYEDHAQKVRNIAEQVLGIQIHGYSKEMSLILNSDANKFHQDQFITQYNYLKNHSHPIPKYALFQDLTLIDWELSKGTFSATLFQDRESSDRFVFPLFEDEVACTVYTEPAIYLGPNTTPEYPGASTLPPHSPIPSLDRYGSLTPGSAKGKRVSVAVRGLVLECEMEGLIKRSKALPVNRYVPVELSDGRISHQYPNGILINELLDRKPLPVNSEWVYRQPDQENMEIFETRPEDNQLSIQALLNTFNLSCPVSEVRVKHLIKKDGGFSRLSIDQLNISKDSILVLVNSSKIPDLSAPYPLAEDFTKQGQPWIQLYHFPSHMAMLISANKLDDLSLTPVEEIMFRDAFQDMECTDPNILKNKMISQIDIFIFPKSAKIVSN